jgi:competence protein ComEA
MDSRKRIKIIAIFIFILTAGTIYSCTSVGKQEPEVVLLNQKQAESSQDQGMTESFQDNKPEESSQNQVSQKSLPADESQIPLQSPKDNIDLIDSEMNHSRQAAVTTVQNNTPYIYVHLCGAVKKPDVYKIEENTRLVDVIELAGGLNEDAAGDFVNQASLLEDGQQIYIPTMDEVKEKTPLDYMTSAPLPDKSESNNLEKSNSKININTASQEELMTLPGIGEAKAKSIVDYRKTHNGFQSIEDIKNIVGIKDSVFQKIKDFISVK